MFNACQRYLSKNRVEGKQSEDCASNHYFYTCFFSYEYKNK